MSEKIKLIFMKDQYDAIMNDDVEATTEQEMAYILFAAAQYAFNKEKINIGEVFGKEFKGLNRSMPNIYSQMDRIKIWTEEQGKINVKYDADAIKELKVNNPTMTAKQICIELGYPEENARSLTSNKGWKEAQQIIKDRNEQTVQKCTESVQMDKTVQNCGVQKNTESVQKSTENVNSDSSAFIGSGFNF